MAWTTISAPALRSKRCARTLATPCWKRDPTCKRWNVPELEASLRRSDVLFEGNINVARALADASWPRRGESPQHFYFTAVAGRDRLPESSRAQRIVAGNSSLTSCAASSCAAPGAKKKTSQLRIWPTLRFAPPAPTASCKTHGISNTRIPNDDGEDSDHWEAFYYPIGDARKTLAAFAALLQGAVPPGIETWPADLLPPVN